MSDVEHARVKELASLGCPVVGLDTVKVPLSTKLRNAFAPPEKHETQQRLAGRFLRRALRLFQPDLVLVSQGENFDGIHYAEICLNAHLPYAIVSHKAADFRWPHEAVRRRMINVFASARSCYFVAEHNRILTEQQMGEPIHRAKVVRNPYLVRADAAPPWPNAASLRLACVARLWVNDKGQDILLRVLSRQKWRGRKLAVSFYGEGPHREALLALARTLDLESVDFPGYVSVESIWERCHGLVLPSRSEGLPLAIVEAMLCRRPAIVTNVGGNAELVDDGATGFVAAAPTDDAFDEALERAWARRDDWCEMGMAAARRVRESVPADPASAFAEELVRVASSHDEAD